MRPREIESYLRSKVLEYFGNDIEDGATINAAHGFYSIEIKRPNDYTISFVNLRRKQLPNIVKALKILGTETNATAT